MKFILSLSVIMFCSALLPAVEVNLDQIELGSRAQAALDKLEVTLAKEHQNYLSKVTSAREKCIKSLQSEKKKSKDSLKQLKLSEEIARIEAIAAVDIFGNEIKNAKIGVDILANSSALQFNLANNLAAGGTATASTVCGNSGPEFVTNGMRSGSVWLMHESKGWIDIVYDKPISARYIVVHSKHGAEGADDWGQASLLINNRVTLEFKGCANGNVIVADLAKNIAISSIRLNIDGVSHPGVAAVELYK